MVFCSKQKNKQTNKQKRRIQYLFADETYFGTINKKKKAAESNYIPSEYVR